MNELLAALGLDAGHVCVLCISTRKETKSTEKLTKNICHNEVGNRLMVDTSGQPDGSLIVFFIRR